MALSNPVRLRRYPRLHGPYIKSAPFLATSGTLPGSIQMDIPFTAVQDAMICTKDNAWATIKRGRTAECKWHSVHFATRRDAKQAIKRGQTLIWRNWFWGFVSESSCMGILMRCFVEFLWKTAKTWLSGVRTKVLFDISGKWSNDGVEEDSLWQKKGDDEGQKVSHWQTVAKGKIQLEWSSWDLTFHHVPTHYLLFHNSLSWYRKKPTKSLFTTLKKGISTSPHPINPILLYVSV